MSNDETSGSQASAGCGDPLAGAGQRAGSMVAPIVDAMALIKKEISISRRMLVAR
jgi:hypothetical protein